MNGPVFWVARRPRTADLSRGLAALTLSAVLVSTGCTLIPGARPSTSDHAGPTSGPPTAALPTEAGSRVPTPADPARGPVASRTDFSAPAPAPASPTKRSSSTSTKPAPPPSGALEWTTTVRKGRQGRLSWAVSIPVFQGAAAGEINRRVRASADDRISLAKLQARQDGGVKRTLEGSSTVTQNDGRTVQVAISLVNYLAGTAHPDDWVNTTVVRTTNGGPVTLDQVFPDERAAYQKLAPEIRRLAKAQQQPVTESDGLGPQRENWAAWQTTRAGMFFYFQDYQLGGHGLRTYTVPWSVLRPLMSDSARRLLAPVG